MPGWKGMPVAEMTEPGLITNMIAFLAIGGAIIAVGIIKVVQEPSAFNLIFYSAIGLFAAWAVLTTQCKLLAELRRRRKSP